MEKVETLLLNNQSHFYTISHEATIAEALSKMCCENNDYLVVINIDEIFMGLITEHDITQKAIFPNKPLSKSFVREIMNTSLPIAATNDSIESCMKLMQQFHISHLPVFDDYEFRGVVSAFDIINSAVFKRSKIFDEEDLLNVEKENFI